jgi:acyl-CoA thioesterase I
MTNTSRPCNTHPEIVAFKYRLPHTAEALTRQRKIKIVAIGSSSTAGTNGVLPFPPRLEFALRSDPCFYGRMIDVINRGIGGQEAPEEISRFECDVIAEAPTLVIWQVGTNAVFRNQDYSRDAVSAAISVGLDWLRPLPMDVVLMDVQFTQAIVKTMDIARDMERRIQAAADKARVNLFRRFDLMEQWCIADGVALADLDDKGEFNLHTSDWATNCLTQALFGAIKATLCPRFNDSVS